MKYTAEQLEAIAAKLRQMPAPEKKPRDFSRQEAVKVLAKEIVALQRRGYSLEQISESLRGEGLDVATPTLKNYLQRSKTTKKKPTAPPAGSSAQPAARKALPDEDSLHPEARQRRNLTRNRCGKAHLPDRREQGRRRQVASLDGGN